MTTKRQQTMAKVQREREVKERRARKLEKKHAAAAERKAKAAEGTIPTGAVTWLDQSGGGTS
jgi:hypothetical protein